MANNLGKALGGLSKPGKILAKPRGTATMTIEPMPAKPKTFTDKNLEPGYGTGGANNVTTRGAKPGGSASPQPNAKPSAAPKGLTKT